MQTSKKLICLFILIALAINLTFSQDVEIIGKLKVSDTELINTADSVVVRLSDGTLAVREKSSLSDGLEKGFFSNTEMNKLIATDGAIFDNFGFSVSIDGDYAVIGANSANGVSSESGAAYIFMRSGANWIQQEKLIADDGAANDRFGYSVSISGDYALIGAYLEDSIASDAGAAYIFMRSGTSWTQQAKLTADEGASNDYFGYSVGIDGDYAIIGASREDSIASDAGAAYIFMRSGTSWTQQIILTASDAQAGDNFGVSVSIDGDYAVIGSYLEDDIGSGAGAAYIFVRSETSWTEQTILRATDGEAGDNFGFSVSIDGEYALIGANFEDEKNFNAGAAYIFVRSGTTWSQQAKLTASDGQEFDLFGISVSIDADYAVIGSQYEDQKGSDAGAAYIFVRSGTTWSQQAKLTASDGAENDNFGRSVSIDGDYALIGAYLEDEKAPFAGASYAFQTGIDQDGDASNELQSLTQSGSTVTLSNGGGSIIVDPSSSNEIQTLSRSGSNISISGGNAVSINDADSDPNNELQSWSTLPGIPSGFADGIDNVVDNLGNHTATTNLNMNNQQILNNKSLTITGFQNTSYSGAGTSMYMQLEIGHPLNNNFRWYLGHQAESPTTGDDDLYFYVEKGSDVANMNVAGYVQDAGTGSQMNFTGQHRSLVDGIDFNTLASKMESLEGLIVVADQNAYLSMSGGLKSGQEAILIDESLPVVSISNKIKDKRVFGVISSMEPENRHDAAGAFATPYHKESGDQRMYINATGEGAIWVVDQGGSLESGDYIQTATVPGYGMKQEDDILHNYTVAKITMDVNFEPRLVAKKQIKKTEQTVDGKVTSVNVLDDYGRIIWEPMKDQEENSVLEYEYKVRYLKDDGTEIDQKTYNQLKCDGKDVYRAAFVGCTYHCG